MGWEGALKMWGMWKERGDGERRKDRERENEERIESGGEVVHSGKCLTHTGRPGFGSLAPTFKNLSLVAYVCNCSAGEKGTGDRQTLDSLVNH